MNIPECRLSDYFYELPEDKIAKYPLKHRDQSKLLIYEQGEISESIFRQLPGYIDPGTLFIFNNTQVFPARLIFYKETGARIEVLCLEPFHIDTYEAQWLCIVGNARKWKFNETVSLYFENEKGKGKFKAVLSEKLNDKFVVDFKWDGMENFYDVIEKIGKIPLPPYLKREPDKNDKHRYQTVYARNTGSVAAPTAGLHFTNEVMQELSKKNIKKDFITLHVGAGTFKPVQNEDVRQHQMHEENFTISKELIKNLLNHKRIFCVGTTSLRNLESIYYIGHNIIDKKQDPFFIQQWDGFERALYDNDRVLSAILDYMEQNNMNEISGKTALMIIPGYEFKFCHGLLTNFHQPESTLLMLVSAFTGSNWRKIYNYALENDFRFLSYGDSSLLIP